MTRGFLWESYCLLTTTSSQYFFFLGFLAFSVAMCEILVLIYKANKYSHFTDLKVSSMDVSKMPKSAKNLIYENNTAQISPRRFSFHLFIISLFVSFIKLNRRGVHGFLDLPLQK